MLPTDLPLPTLTISLYTILAEGADEKPSPAPGDMQSFWLQLEFEDPADPERHEVANQLVAINRGILRRFENDPARYGLTLSGMLFQGSAVRKYFEDAWLVAFRTAKGLRVVLNLDSSAPGLHSLRWETLCHPRTGRFLFTDANLPFSRYLEKGESGQWQAFELRPKSELKALVVAANPEALETDLELEGNQPLARIDVEGELRRAEGALSGVTAIDRLASGLPGQAKVTLPALQSAIGRGYDILYLVCHGVLLKGEGLNAESRPYLLLEDERDTYALVDGEILADILGGLEAGSRPRLVALASCQSAGAGRSTDNGALAALGPRLAQAGVPAVIAMQSKVLMTTVERFMPAFFTHLVKDGQIERAMALARSAVQNAEARDWWSPVLFTRLKNGCLYEKTEAGQDVLENYLRTAGQEMQFSRSVNRKLEVLWSQPFEAHLLGATPVQRKDLYEQISSLFAPGATDRYQRAVLLGATGQGKSVALQAVRTRFAAQALQIKPGLERRPWTADDPGRERMTIPIYASLNDLRPEITLEDLAVHSVNRLLDLAESKHINARQLEKWSADSNSDLLFLFDDLEALITGRFGVGLKTLLDFMSARSFNHCQFLVACRSSSYQGQLGSVLMLELDDLSEQQVEDVLGPAYHEMRAPMQRIARNRSMLRLILDVQGHALRTKGQLTQAWVEKSLGLQDERIDGLDCALVKHLLEQLAYEMRCSHTHVYSEGQLSEVISKSLTTNRELYNWRYVLYVLRSIGALECDSRERLYSFSERIFSDYFSAAAVAHSLERRQHVLATVSDYWWRDMLELLVGIIDQPEELLYEMIDRDVLVAAHCIPHVAIHPESPVYSALVDGLVEYMDRESSGRRKRMVDRINEHNHKRVPEVLLRRLHREWSSTVMLSIVRGLEWSKRRFGEPMLLETERYVQETSVQDSISFEPWLQVPLPAHEPGTAGWLPAMEAYIFAMRQIMEDRQCDSRLRGIAAISLGLTHHEPVTGILIERTRDPLEVDLVAWCAAEGLTEFRSAGLYKTICDCTCDDALQGYPRIRARFIYMLRSSNIALAGDPGDEDCGPSASRKLLLDAIADRHPIVRGNAVLTMARLGFRDAVSEIQKLLKRESEPFVLSRIAEALALVGQPETIRHLESKLNDSAAQENWAIRSTLRTAIREIKERYNI